MESLLQRMSERYKSRSMKKDDVQTDSKENEKTRKLKNMIEILREKIVKYESEVEITETVGVDSNIVTEAVASGEGDTVVAGATVVNILLKCSLQNSYGFGVKVFKRFFREGSASQLVNQ